MSMAADIASGVGLNLLHLAEYPPAGQAGPDIASAATIPFQPAVQRYTPLAARTGLILQQADRPCIIAIINEAALSATSLTFAAVGTSFVQGGTGVIIPGSSCALFVYDDKAGVWFPFTSSAGSGSALTPPAVPASTVAATNNTGHNAMVTILTGSVTNVAVNGNNMSNLTQVFVPAGQTIALTYTGGTPTWQWFATS